MGDVVLEAAHGLTFRLTREGRGTVAFGEPDWLGPIGARLETSDGAREVNASKPHLFSGEDDLGSFSGLRVDAEPPAPAVRCSARACRDRPVLVFRIEAAQTLASLSRGSFAMPSVAWPWFRPALRASRGIAEGARGFGHQYTEFAFPTFAGADLDDFLLLPNRPAVVGPLWLGAPDGRCLLLAPLDAFHEQVIVVPTSREQAMRLGVRAGWHGDLDFVERGFSTELALWAGSGHRRVLEQHCGLLRKRYGTRRPSRYADEGVGKLSYWTDNGAAYWYRTEGGRDVAATLEHTLDSLRASGVPVRAVQLDSWFYPHETPRPFDTPDADVPPTGMMAWEARPDVLPEGIGALRRRLGDPPLILHSRHFSSRSPYFDREPAWRDGDRTHPKDPRFFGLLLDEAASWGAVTFEQDWLVEMFLGVRGLRERPGRARAWHEAVDRAAAERGLTLQWCMPSPADFFRTLSLSRVTSIRTSGDYRYLVGSAMLWCWFLYTNALARALGLNPYKDVFLSCRDGTGRDGDPHAEVEAMLAALSAGPVGIGDRAGRTDPEVVLRACRADGVLLKPHAPLAALDRCFRSNAFAESALLFGETFSAHGANRWTYVAALNASQAGEAVAAHLDWGEVGVEQPAGSFVVYDWRRRSFGRARPEGLDVRLEPDEWALWVLCPIFDCGVTLVGDVDRYATMADRRVGDVRVLGNAVEATVLGAPGEKVTLTGWSDGFPPEVRAWSPDGETDAGGSLRREGDGGWALPIRLGDRGWLRLRMSGPGRALRGSS